MDATDKEGVHPPTADWKQSAVQVLLWCGWWSEEEGVGLQQQIRTGQVEGLSRYANVLASIHKRMWCDFEHL
jgi:hypothetical protein